MGNQLSTPQQRKLAKPKTNNSAPNQRLPSASQVVELLTPPVTISNIGEVDMATIGTSGDRRSLPGALQKLRDRTLSFGGNDSIDTFGDDDSTVGSLGAIVSGVRDRISRSGSLSSSRMSSARTSLTRLTSLGGPPRISLVIESGVPDAGATGLVRQEIEENARANELALQHISAPSPTSEYSPSCPSCTPIRRKSLLTPGIATRGRPSNILRKAPPPGELQTQADRDYYFNSSLTQPDTFDLVEEERRSLEQRAATPCDQEFGVLGVFKRGTLRITNGAASPAPSERTLSHALGGNPSPISGESDEEYFSASEGGGSLENEHTPISGRVIPRRSGGSIDAGPDDPIHEEKGEFDGMQKSQGISTNGEWQRSSSPLQDDMYFREEPAEVLNETSAVSLSPPEVPVRSPDRASKIAQQYIQELAPLVRRRSSSVIDTSPSLPGVASAGAQRHEIELPNGPISSRKTELEFLTTGPTSNFSAVRADTFDDEGIEVSPVLQKISDITHLVQRWSVGKHTYDYNACHSDIQLPSTASSPAATECPPCSEYPSYQPMPSRTLSKADSGYDSQYSVKSVAMENKTTRQDSGFSDCSERSAPISNASSNSRLWAEQGFEVTHERPFSKHANAVPSSKAPPALRPSPLPADAAETTVIMIPPPKSKFRGLRKSLPPGTSQQVPPSQSLRTPRPMLQPPIPPPRSSSVTVRTYRNISQAHIPPSTLVDTTSKPVQRRSNHLPLLPKSSESPKPSEPILRPLAIRNGNSPLYRSCSVIARPSTDRWQSDLATGPGSFRQRGRLTNRSSHQEEASGLVHERSRTRSRSQGPISRVEPGITGRCQSMYAGKNPLVLPSR
ncbi:MAG: hypothetical protein M1840_007128 [Geoglossum simile]|nr:MAG: hypothetical protein M1840_007128 [Geoglossum simile]